ncbi:MAG: hypothetical protein ROW48_05425 [Bellilinea sp.]|jgi:hypothetical protein
MTNDYILLDDLKTALRYWWLIIIGMLAGLSAGWVVSQMQPPLYEARAIIAINVDLARTGTLSDLNQDILINTTGRIMASAPIMDDLRRQAAQTGMIQTGETFNRLAFIERKAESFVLRVQHHDPQSALNLVDRWSDLAMRALETASQRALAAETMQRYLDGLVECIRAVPAAGVETNYCAMTNLNQVQQEIERTGAEILLARHAARGIIPGLRFTLTHPAALLPEAAQFERSNYLLAGAGIGLLLALWAIHLRLPARWTARKSRG